MYKPCMNPLKCAFRVSTIKFLGSLVHHRGISVDLTKATAIATIKRPTTVKELKSFLGRDPISSGLYQVWPQSLMDYQTIEKGN